jgi:hypothetical protein
MNGMEEEEDRDSRRGLLIFSLVRDTMLTQDPLSWMVEWEFQTSHLFSKIELVVYREQRTDLDKQHPHLHLHNASFELNIQRKIIWH